MAILDCFRTRIKAGDGWRPPQHDNDNWRLMREWVTPAEFMQWLRRTREEMRRELAADFTLRSDPEHRKTWEELAAMERCCLWHYYGER